MYDFDTEIKRIGTHSLKWESDTELPMWVADMDFAVAPCIKDAIIARANHGVFGYSVVPDCWHESIIKWWDNRHGFKIEKEWLQFATGIVPAISSMVKRLTNVGDNVAVLTPVYDIFFHSIENFGRHTLECKLQYGCGKYEIDFLDLEKVLSNPLTTLLILCNPHNPTGKIWSKAELKKIGELCHKYGVTVISDEIHCDITAPNKKYVPFASVDNVCKDISVTCISASKAFNIAGLQSAAVVISNPILRNKVNRGLNSDEVAEPNCFAVVATVAAFTEGEPWLNELNAYIAENKRIAKEFFSKLDVCVVDSDASYLMWIDCKLDTDSFCDFLLRTTLLHISPGSQYRGNSNTFVRMNLACPRSRLLDGLNRFEKGIKEYKNKLLSVT